LGIHLILSALPSALREGFKGGDPIRTIYHDPDRDSRKKQTAGKFARHSGLLRLNRPAPMVALWNRITACYDRNEKPASESKSYLARAKG